MPFAAYDPIGNGIAAANAGSNIAANINSANSNAIRLQQLKSEDALRQVQQRLYNQQISELIYKHDMEVNEKADSDKAMARINAEQALNQTLPQTIQRTRPIEMKPGGPETETVEVPNPSIVPFEQSVQKYMLPVMAKYHPDKVPALMNDLALYPYRMAEARNQSALAVKNYSNALRPKPLSGIGKMQADREIALQNGDLTAAREIGDAITRLHSTAASEVQKMIDEHKKQTGRDFTPEETDDLYRIKMGLKSKAAVVQPLTFEKFANKNLQWYMDNKTHFDPATKKLRRPSSTQEAMGDMKGAYDSMQDHIANMPSVQGQTGAKVRTYNPQTGQLTPP